jgi:hypothetical protein
VSATLNRLLLTTFAELRRLTERRSGEVNICMREVRGSNLGHDTGNSECLHVFFQ